MLMERTYTMGFNHKVGFLITTVSVFGYEKNTVSKMRIFFLE